MINCYSKKYIINNVLTKFLILPQKAAKSLTHKPAAITSLPLFTVPAHNGIYNRLASSSNSSTLVKGWTNPKII